MKILLNFLILMPVSYTHLIIDIPRGDTGFGYDPHFYVAEYGKTLAEMPEMKNVISHRANALKKLEVELEEILKD